MHEGWARISLASTYLLNHIALKHTILMNTGTSTLRVGFSGDEAPRAEDPVIVGRPYLPTIPALGVSTLGFQIDDDDDEEVDEDDDDVVVGTAAVNTSSRGVYRLSAPMSRGIVTNWTDMERIWYVDSLLFLSLYFISRDFFFSRSYFTLEFTLYSRVHTHSHTNTNTHTQHETTTTGTLRTIAYIQK